jgi:hypothetical protein
VRTTLSLEDDAIRAIQPFARSHRLSLGEAASELVRRGIRYQIGTRKVNGLPVFDTPDYFPRITTRQVLEFLNSDSSAS